MRLRLGLPSYRSTPGNPVNLRTARETKIPSLLAIVGLAISLTAPSFAEQKDTVDLKTDQQIRVLAAKYDEAYNKHDSAAVAALYTEDGVYATRHGTYHGRRAIEKGLAKDEFQHWRTQNIVKTVNRIIADGNEIRARGTWSLNYQRNPFDTLRNADGTFSWVMVREGDTWKIRRDTVSESTEKSNSGVAGSDF
jgi:uncharacterized protein (TIGR02246 family)